MPATDSSTVVNTMISLSGLLGFGTVFVWKGKVGAEIEAMKLQLKQLEETVRATTMHSAQIESLRLQFEDFRNTLRLEITTLRTDGQKRAETLAHLDAQIQQILDITKGHKP